MKSVDMKKHQENDAFPKIEKANKQTEKLPPLSIYLSLIPKKERNFFIKYLRYVQQLSMRGLGEKRIHKKSFNYLYRAVSDRQWSEKNLLGYLQKEFIVRNLSLSLLLEPLDGFEWMSKNLYPLELTEASPIGLQIISPITRMVAVLNNQTPPFYQPFSNLVFSYISRYVQEYYGLRTILKQVGVSIGDKRINQRLEKGLKEERQLLSVSRGLIFRIKIGFFIGLNALLTKKTIKKVNFFIYVNAFLYGLGYNLTTKNQTKNMKIR